MLSFSWLVYRSLNGCKVICENVLIYGYNLINSDCNCICREQCKPNSGRDRCRLWDPGNPLYHCHYTILLQVQMQKVQKMQNVL